MYRSDEVKAKLEEITLKFALLIVKHGHREEIVPNRPFVPEMTS